MVFNGFMHNMIKFIFRVFRHIKNRIGILWEKIFLKLSKITNNFSMNAKLPDAFVSSFRKSKEAAVSILPAGDRIFAWALLESDGRIKKYGNLNDDSEKKSWEYWLNDMMKFQHFQWRAPHDPEIKKLSKKIKQTGLSTWKKLFKKYRLHNLNLHDLYSLPDVYYTTKILGRVPESVIDVGGGWGRLGMAWHAVGSRVVGVTDSIEQPYVIQHQYLSSVPGADFFETLDGANEEKLNFNMARGIVHFPLWSLLKIPDESVDAVSTIQVLREVPKECLEFLFSELHRILKKGGVWYIRDNDHEYKNFCMHNVPVTNRLQSIGFKLVHQSSLKQGVDIHGVPRIFQKIS